MANLNEIFGWFSIGKTPTAEQFKQSWSSFRHKSEKIEQTAILGLNDALKDIDETKADKSDLDNIIGGMLPKGEVANISDLPTIPFDEINAPDGVKTGYSYIVTSEKDADSGLSYIYVAEIKENNGVKTVVWQNTKLTTYPKDVARTGGSDKTVKDIENEMGYKDVDPENRLTSDSTHGYYNIDGEFRSEANWRCALLDTTKSKSFKIKIIAGVAIGVIGFKDDGSFVIIQKTTYEGNIIIPDDVVLTAISTRSLETDVYYCYLSTSLGGYINQQQKDISDQSKQMGYEEANQQESFLTSDSDKGYFDTSGIWHDAANWRGVKIETSEQKKFNIKTVMIGFVPVSIGGFKSDGSYIVIQQNTFDREITIAEDIVIIVVSTRALTGDTYYCYPIVESKSIGLLIQDLKKSVYELESKPTNGIRDIKSFIPDYAYAVKGEPLRIYTGNFIGVNENDTSLDVWFDKQLSNEKCLFIDNPQTDEVLTVKIRNYDGVIQVLGNIHLKVVEPENPLTPLFVLPIGDSLTAASNGAYVNELSRMLTGIGTEIANGQTTKAFNNIHFIGTLGANPVKHEGRGGWSLSSYLNSQADNAFYNPDKKKFDLDFYLSQNGFYTQGVATDGSNLIITIMLNWNSVYNHTDTQFKTWYNELLSLIHSSHPQARVLIFGINTPPSKNYKSYSGSRNVSRASIMEDCIRFETMLREIVSTNNNSSFCTHFPLLPFFCPDESYPIASLKVNLRTTTKTDFYTDYVHPNLTGYGQIADIFYRAICSMLS